MKSSRSIRSSGSRLGSVIALSVIAAAALTACGGGGGSASPATPSIPTAVVDTTPVKILSVGVTSVSISGFSAADAKGVPVNSVFTGNVVVTGAPDAMPVVKVRIDIAGCPNSQSVDGVVTMVSVTTGRFTATPTTLGVGLTCTFTLAPSVNGSAGTSINGSFTTTSKLVYDTTFTGVYGGSPAVLVGNTPTVATNKTSHGPMGNCLMGEGLSPLGFQPYACMDNKGVYYVVGLNPIAKEYVDLSEALGAGYEISGTNSNAMATFGSKWHSCQRTDACKSGWQTPPQVDMWVWAPAIGGGWVYNDATDGRILRKVDGADVKSVLYTDTNGAAFNVLAAISSK